MSKAYPKIDTGTRRTIRPIFVASRYIMKNNAEPNGNGVWVFRDGDHREFSFAGSYGKAKQKAEEYFSGASFIFLSLKSVKHK
jgi:hypothetical protein